MAFPPPSSHLNPSRSCSVLFATRSLSIFLADHFGLVALIARGYRALAWLFLVVYVVPLLTLGAWRLWRRAPVPLAAAHP